MDLGGTLHIEKVRAKAYVSGDSRVVTNVPALPGYCQVTAHAQADVLCPLMRSNYSSQGAFHDLIFVTDAVRGFVTARWYRVSFFVISEMNVFFYHVILCPGPGNFLYTDGQYLPYLCNGNNYNAVS